VGVRDIDVLHPGSNLPPIDDPALHGVLALGGALQVPLEALGSDRFGGSFVVDKPGRWQYAVAAWNRVRKTFDCERLSAWLTASAATSRICS